MSRIYEALQRADRERELRTGTAPVSAAEFSRKVDPVPSVPAPDSARPAITECTWRPVVDAMPCLMEFGQLTEQFRGLRSRLTQFRQEAPIKTLLISSAMPAEGKSFVSLNLAISLSRHNSSRVLLIDGDLRQPSLYRSLGTGAAPGLSEYLSGTAELSEVLQCNEKHRTGEDRIDGPLSRLTFIPAGTPRNNSSDLLLNSRMTTLIATLGVEFDWILIDSPPVLAISDALEIARNADAVMLVARQGHTPFAAAQRAQAAFHNSRLLGFVLNGAKEDEYSYYSSYYSASNLSPSEITAIPQ